VPLKDYEPGGRWFKSCRARQINNGSQRYRPFSFWPLLLGCYYRAIVDGDGRVIGANLPMGNGPLLEQPPAIAAGLPHSVALEFDDFDSEFTLEPRGDQVAMTPRTAGFDLPAALPAAEDRRRASACERA